jgi:glycosyltransferase involved in cell wall biosynthesis
VTDHPITRSPDHPILQARILYIAYPLLTVSEQSAGGAEQVLWILEREMARYGLNTAVAASVRSCVTGELLSTGEPCFQLDDFARRNREHQERILEIIWSRAARGRAFDLVHDMSGSFWSRAAEIDAPVLATLHLPRDFYLPALFENIPGNVEFNCVSHSQARSFAGLKQMAGVVGNGIALDRFERNLEQKGRSGLLWLGRICQEKAPHLALDIAERAGMHITLAGQVYPFSCHQQYFDRELAPRLQRMAGARFIDHPSQQRKQQLLCSTRAVLITSQVEETSCLVAMEAVASGTPVIALDRGALPEIVRDGVTGFVVEELDAAVQALGRLQEIDPAACVRHAHDHFSSAMMAVGYLQLYKRALESETGNCRSAAEPQPQKDPNTEEQRKQRTGKRHVERG